MVSVSTLCSHPQVFFFFPNYAFKSVSYQCALSWKWASSLCEKYIISAFLPSLQALYVNYISIYSEAAREHFWNALFHFSYSAHCDSQMVKGGGGDDTWKGEKGFLVPGVVAAGGKIIAGGVWEEKNDGVPGWCSSGIYGAHPKASLAERFEVFFFILLLVERDFLNVLLSKQTL